MTSKARQHVAAAKKVSKTAEDRHERMLAKHGPEDWRTLAALQEMKDARQAWEDAGAGLAGLSREAVTA